MYWSMIIALTCLVLVNGQLPLSCDFESGDTCSYFNYNGNYWGDWQVTKGGNASRGPLVDHTLGTEDGQFAVFSGIYYRNSFLDSVNITTCADHCISFWFYMSNDTVAYLDVFEYVRHSYSHVLYYYPSGQGLDKQWIFGYADISTTANSLIYFKATINDNYSYPPEVNFVALDDVKVTSNTTCQALFGRPSTRR